MKTSRTSRNGHRVYSEEERLKVLEAFKANDKDANLTAAQVGIPANTIRRWSMQSGDLDVGLAGLRARTVLAKKVIEETEEYDTKLSRRKNQMELSQCISLCTAQLSQAIPECHDIKKLSEALRAVADAYKTVADLDPDSEHPASANGFAQIIQNINNNLHLHSKEE